MHLAIADLSVGLVNVLTDIIWKITIEWNAGNIACKVVRFSQVFFISQIDKLPEKVFPSKGKRDFFPGVFSFFRLS